LPEEAKYLLSNTLSELREKSGRKWKWENLVKYHLTLKFLGECDPEIEGQIIQTLKKYSASGVFNFTYEKFGFFSERGIPRIFWAGLGFEEDIYALVHKIDLDMSVLNFVTEKRRFNPHITLLRIKDFYDIRDLEEFDGRKISGDSFTADTLCLYNSELKPSGSEYSKIFEINLSN